MEQCRILAPEREGRMGVHALNATVERWLQGRGVVAVRDEWYHMRPILIEANDYTVGVFNGDLGVVWREGSESSVYFRSSNGGVRAMAPVRVPAAQTAWAMTVHKSQGSEFDEVIVVVPEHESRVLSRQLLYTAVTRARRRVTLVASTASLESALARASRRSSGLEWALAAL
jgi:exodeoxyribonuclease V alpha subunit